MAVKRKNKTAVMLVYIGAVLLGVFFFIADPSEVMHFIGASSLAYAFIFALSLGSKLVFWLGLTWIVLFPVILLLAFLFSKKAERVRPFSFVILLELSISLLFLAWKLVSGNDYQLGLGFVGFLLRGVFGAFIVSYLNRPTERENCNTGAS